MNLLFWKFNSAIDTLAHDIANDIYAAIQPQAIADFYEGKCDKNQAKKIEKTLNNRIQMIIIKIKDFKAMNPIGVYGKARLHLKFKERLQELGYTSSVSTKLNHIIMVETP
jgi:hypothetical protein